MMKTNSKVPIPENNKVVLGEKPVMIGTKKVAPNIAAMCWVPIPIVRGQLSRSLGPTTSPDATVFPSPCSVQIAIFFLPDWLLVSNLEFDRHFAAQTRHRCYVCES